MPLLSLRHNPERSFRAYGAKVPIGKQWAQGDQAPGPNPSLLIPTPMCFLLSLLLQEAKDWLEEIYFSILLCLFLSPPVSFTHIHTNICTHFCLTLKKSEFVLRYNLLLTSFNPIHLALGGLIIILIMVFKVSPEVQWCHILALHLLLPTPIINFHDAVEPKLSFLTWVNFYYTLLVLLTVILLIHLARFWVGPSSTPPKWKPLLWEVSGLETIQPHPNHTAMELKGMFYYTYKLVRIKKTTCKIFQTLEQVEFFYSFLFVFWKPS